MAQMTSIVFEMPLMATAIIEHKSQSIWFGQLG